MNKKPIWISRLLPKTIEKITPNLLLFWFFSISRYFAIQGFQAKKIRQISLKTHFQANIYWFFGMISSLKANFARASSDPYVSLTADFVACLLTQPRMRDDFKNCSGKKAGYSNWRLIHYRPLHRSFNCTLIIILAFFKGGEPWRKLLSSPWPLWPWSLGQSCLLNLPQHLLIGEGVLIANSSVRFALVIHSNVAAMTQDVTIPARPQLGDFGFTAAHIAHEQKIQKKFAL